MTIDDRGAVCSDLAIPPGETLADEIAARGMSQTELATRLGRPVQVVNEIIHGKKAITDNTALGLAPENRRLRRRFSPSLTFR